MVKIFCSLITFLFPFILQATTYYSIASASPHLLTSWKTQRDGTGTSPSNFTTSGDIFIVQGIGGLSGAPHSMTTSSTWSIGASVTVKVETNALLQGNSNITFNATANFILDSAATYHHNNTGSYSGQILAGIENFHKYSDFILLNSANTGPITPANGGFGNLIIDVNLGSQTNCSGTLTAIKNNFIIKNISASGREFRLTGATDYTLAIGGDLVIQNGILSFSSGNGNGIVNLGGSFNMTGGTLLNGGSNTPSAAQFINFTGNKMHSFIKSGGIISAPGASGNRIITFTVANTDTLDMSNQIMDGSKTGFILNNGATLQIGHSNGITTKGNNIGNIQTDSIRSFSKLANYIYAGPSLQLGGNGLPDTINAIKVNNANGLTLSNDSLICSTKLFLTNGKIITDNTHTLVLSKTATISSAINSYGDANEGNLTSFISGPLKIETNATTAFTVPIGKDTSTGIFFAPIHLQPVTAVTKIFTTEYFPNGYDTANYDVNIHHVSQIEHWKIDCTNATTPDGNAFVELSWRPTSALCIPNCTTLDSTNAWSDLTVAHYFNNAGFTKWWLEGVTPTFTMRTGSTLSYGFVKTNLAAGSFSPFTLASKSGYNILPLQIIRFEAAMLNNYITVIFETTNELGIEKMVLEKSYDGIHFQNIQNFAPKYTASNFYSFLDYTVTAANYYRLKIIALDGSISYSPIIQSRIEKGNIVSVYPNPFVKTITIQNITNCTTDKLNIFDALGKLVFTNKTNLTNNTLLNLGFLQKGIYKIVLHTNKTIFTQTVIKL